MLKLNGEPFALPFRISGNWLAPSISIDNAAVTRQLQQRAVGEIGSRITNELGGDLGGLVNDVLGGSGTPSKNETDDDSAAAPQTEPEPEAETLEDAVEDLAKDALGDLFGGGD